MYHRFANFNLSMNKLTASYGSLTPPHLYSIVRYFKSAYRFLPLKAVELTTISHQLLLSSHWGRLQTLSWLANPVGSTLLCCLRVLFWRVTIAWKFKRKFSRRCKVRWLWPVNLPINNKYVQHLYSTEVQSKENHKSFKINNMLEHKQFLTSLRTFWMQTCT